MSQNSSSENPIASSEDQDIKALFSSFRIDQNSYRTFTRHRNSKPVEASVLETVQSTAPRPGSGSRIAIFSPMGGSGKSILAATLAAVLWQLGRNVLLVDASPWSSLAFHFGASSARPGMRSFFAPGSDLPVRLLSRDTDESSLPQLETYLVDEPADHVILDLSGVAGSELVSSLEESTQVLVPLIPDASALRAAASVSALVSRLRTPPERMMYLVNQMQDTLLARDTFAGLSQALGDQLYSKPIYCQGEIQEATAEGITLPFYAPQSEAVAVCHEIVQWIDLPRPSEVSKPQLRWSER
jgi:cellulose biosynthesis protein BcsQ